MMLHPIKNPLLLILLGGFTIVTAKSQTIEILTQVNSPKPKSDSRFEYLNHKTNIASLQLVATVRAVGKDKNSNIPKLFFAVKHKAYELGANCFKINSYVKQGNTQEKILILDVYRAKDSILNLNSSSHEKNVVFIFLDDSNTIERYTFTINDIDRKIKSGTYYRYDIHQGKSMEIDGGSFFDPTFRFKWKENGPSIFFTLTDFGLDSNASDYDYMGKYFNTKRLNPIDENLGYMLIKLLIQNQ